ncbi:hypothetical protein CLOSYM_04485 [[Clostridium] symbiosum ATCC 14940]|uniref:Uncharacterized protein n=1 Tax=[Clostridium] symbiosum ATCC 14940 TaxID=411472 RepID=A0ABC9TRI9_CLOSY|nr:hypothetical protein CLOSYM_04485 [[Clostridium] symbiosum ATCC 14940]
MLPPVSFCLFYIFLHSLYPIIGKSIYQEEIIQNSLHGRTPAVKALLCI